MSVTATHATLSAQSPWPGLAAFAEDDRDFFRGRDRETDELARLVRRERLSVLFGRSGLGKSSLLAAGLAPRLRDDLHLPMLLRIDYRAGLAPRAQVWQALMAEAQRWQVSAEPPHDDESLWAYFHRAGGGFWNARNRPVLPVLVFDRFEELFTLGQADDATRACSTAFIAELADLVEDRMPLALQQALESDPHAAEGYDGERRGCKVVLSFREDFLAQVEGLRGSMPSLIRNRFRLLPMDRAQAGAVVASGGDLVGIDVAPHLLGLAWNNKAEPPPDDGRALEFDPALLSVICAELNRLRLAAGEARIDIRRLETSGTGILGNFYDRTMEGIGASLRHFVEDELVTPTGVRDSRALDDALARPDVDAAEVMRLVDGRLLRMDERFGAQRLELTHDVLTGVVAERRRARRARQAEAEAEARAQQARVVQRRVRRTWAVALVGVLAAVGLLVWAIDFAKNTRNEAENARNDAELERIKAKNMVLKAKQESEQIKNQAALLADKAASASAQAGALLRDANAKDLILNAKLTAEDQLDRALLLGAVAVQAYPDRLQGQVEQLARLLAVDHLAALRRLDMDFRINAASADDRWLAIGTPTGEVLLLDTARWQIVRRWQTGSPMSFDRLAYSPDGQWLVTAQQGALVVWRTADGTAMHRNNEVRGDVRRIVFSADGRQLAVSVSGSVWLWTLPSLDNRGRTLALGNFGYCLAFDGPSRLLLSGADGDAVWDGEQLQSHGRRLNKSDERVLATSSDCQFDVVGVEVKPSAPATESLWTVHLRRPFEGRRLGELGSFAGNEPDFQFAPAGSVLLHRKRADLQVWATDPLKSLGQFNLDKTKSSLVLSPDGRLLASVTRAGLNSYGLKVFDNADGAVRAELALTSEPEAIHFSAGNTTLFVKYSHSRIGQAKVLRLAQSQSPSQLQLRRDGSPYKADGLEFNHSGRMLLTTGSGGSPSGTRRVARYSAPSVMLASWCSAPTGHSSPNGRPMGKWRWFQPPTRPPPYIPQLPSLVPGLPSPAKVVTS